VSLSAPLADWTIIVRPAEAAGNRRVRALREMAGRGSRAQRLRATRQAALRLPYGFSP